MIAKHISMKSAGKSDFVRLVHYITNPQHKTERVGEVRVTNCYSDQAEGAALEVLNTQMQNHRAESDKSYHLILSFRAGEQPEPEMLEAIEARICEGLGYAEHQRISAVHYDTDNMHVHIAINKIHPTRYTIHDPFRDYRTLSQLCEKLEREYGLEPDNHQPRKSLSENRAQDMERHTGVESLLGWIKRECLGQIQSAGSWAALHQVLQSNGLEINERGNGLVISDGKAIIKASSVSRDLSKAKLEARFGPFQPAPELSNAKPLRRYDPRPVRTRMDTSELYTKYRAEQERNRREGQAKLADARNRKAHAINTAKSSGRLKRAAIKVMTSGMSKRALYSLAAKSLKDEIQKVVKQYNAERTAIHQKYRREAWADWLRRKATDGDPVALAALRAREGAQKLKGNTIAGLEHRASGAMDAAVDGVTKKGTVIYRVGNASIRDDGDKFAVSKGATEATVEAALRMALKRYGYRLTVTGSEEFKERVASVAAKARLPVIFSDVALERRRRALAAEVRAAIWATKRAVDVGDQPVVEGFGIKKLILGRSRGRGRSR